MVMPGVLLRRSPGTWCGTENCDTEREGTIKASSGTASQMDNDEFQNIRLRHAKETNAE